MTGGLKANISLYEERGRSVRRKKEKSNKKVFLSLIAVVVVILSGLYIGHWNVFREIAGGA